MSKKTHRVHTKCKEKKLTGCAPDVKEKISPECATSAPSTIHWICAVNI